MSDAKASKTRTLFRLEYAISAEIDAPPERIWALVTDAAALVRWNSTITALDGRIAEGERIALKVTAAPERTFKLKVSDMKPARGMVWSDGFAPMFRGVRTYALTDLGDGRTRFEMREVLSGLMLPLIAGSLPDFATAFEAWVADLKAEVARG